MSRRVTVTFDNGATHTYEGVPMSATPESVLERARRDFGDRAVTNIDGGREKGGKDYVLDVGKGLASLADVALSVPGAIAGEVAYAGGRAFGQTPEQASALRQTVTGATTNPIGQALGITQDPAYQGEAVRSAFGALGQGIQSAAAPVAQATGLPQADVESMMGSALTAVAPAAARGTAAAGRGVAQGAQAVGQGAVAVAKAPVQFGRGFAQGVLNPEPTPTSAMVPLQKQAYPAQAGREFMSGQLDLAGLEASRVPSASLFASGVDQAALKALPRNAAGEPLVPLAGRGIEAIGENLGRSYRNQPLLGAADLGLMSLNMPPIGPAARAVQGLASMRASKAADFSPGFTERLGAAQSQAALAPNPQLRLPAPATPVAGPVAPQTMYAGTGGVSTDLPTAGRAALQQRYAAQSATPQQTAQQAAAAKIQPPATPLQAAAQQAVASKVRRPNNVREMIVPEQNSSVYPSKAEFDKANLFNITAGKPAVGSYREGNKIITVTPYQGQWPMPPGYAQKATTMQAVDATTGKRVPVGKTWNAAIGDAEPLSSKVRAKLKKD